MQKYPIEYLKTFLILQIKYFLLLMCFVDIDINLIKILKTIKFTHPCVRVTIIIMQRMSFGDAWKE